MNSKILFVAALLSVSALAFAAENTGKTAPAKSGRGGNDATRNVNVTPQAIPGSAKSAPGQPAGGYAPSNVQAQIKIEVKDGISFFLQ